MQKPLAADCPFPLEKSQLSTRKFEGRMSKKERGLTKGPSGNTQCHTVTLKWLDYSNALMMQYSDFRRKVDGMSTLRHFEDC